MGANLQWRQVDSFSGNFKSSPLTSHRSCPVCNSLTSRVFLELEDFQFYTDSAQTPKRADIRQTQCLDCFALYLNPCYSSLGFEYLFSEASHSYGSTNGRSKEQLDWLTSRDLLETGGMILDVGCSEGRFLEQLPENLTRVGLDIDSSAVERARQRLQDKGIEFVVGDFESFQFSGSPSTITMFHVLEHLPRPVSALKKLRSLASDQTRLVVEVPILERGVTNDINGFFSVQHMTHFSRQSLKNCLWLAGWEVGEWFEQPNYNGCRVLAVPSPEHNHIKASTREQISLSECLGGWQQSISKVSRVLAGLEDQERCIIWGGGAHTEFLYQTTLFFHSKPDREYVIVDVDSSKQGKSWRGIPICSPSNVSNVSGIALLISSYGSQEKIHQQATELGIPCEHLIKLYSEIRVY